MRQCSWGVLRTEAMPIVEEQSTHKRGYAFWERGKPGDSRQKHELASLVSKVLKVFVKFCSINDSVALVTFELNEICKLKVHQVYAQRIAIETKMEKSMKISNQL